MTEGKRDALRLGLLDWIETNGRSDMVMTRWRCPVTILSMEPVDFE